MKLKEELKAAGKTDAEIKEYTKKKPQEQEDHHDDCGSDTELLEEKEAQSMLATTYGDLDDVIAHCFFDDTSTGEIEDDSWEESLRGHFAVKYLYGTEAEDYIFWNQHPDEK